MGFLRGRAPSWAWHLHPFPPADDAQPGSSAGPTGKDKDKALPSFWIPSLTPEAKATKLEKPVSIPSTLCPLGPRGPEFSRILSAPFPAWDAPILPTPGPSLAC